MFKQIRVAVVWALTEADSSVATAALARQTTTEQAVGDRASCRALARASPEKPAAA